MAVLPCRFDAASHTYYDLSTGAVLKHVTGLLEAAGLVDARWYTEASCARGHAVHALTTQWDLDALDLDACASPYRPYLLGYQQACAILQPKWSHIEQPLAHAGFRFAGRPDRAGRVHGAAAVVEIKSGAAEPAHAMQLSLQAILLADDLRVPAEAIHRYALYVKPSGRFAVVRHKDPTDFDRAYRLLREHAGRPSSLTHRVS